MFYLQGAKYHNAMFTRQNKEGKQCYKEGKFIYLLNLKMKKAHFNL